MILDKAGQKGTGQWTTRAALSLGVPVPCIAAAVDARTLSSMRTERLVAAERLFGPSDEPATKGDLVQALHAGLLAAKIIAYAQGMHLISVAAKVYGWSVNLMEVARIWKGGCIIRASLLDDIMRAFGRNADLSNLMLDKEFSAMLNEHVDSLRTAVALGLASGIPVPALSAALSYYDAYRSPRLPQNLIQAQRDAFGSHTYQRLDDPDGPFVHTNWTQQSP